MKRLLGFLCVMFVFGLLVVANATLYVRGGDLIYDDDLDITWMQDANYSGGWLTWDEAMTWAGGLEYQGYTDWRLPDAHNYMDGSGPEEGYVTGSEMGHIYYTQLGNPVGGPLTYTFPFVNLEHRDFISYWTGTEYDSSSAWDFDFNTGNQDWSLRNNGLYARAVRDGAPVPGPRILLLLGGGLLGFAAFGKSLVGQGRNLKQKAWKVVQFFFI